MPLNLRIYLLLFSLFVIILISYILKRGRMPIKYSLVWYFAAFIVILVSLFPESLILLTNLIGFKTLSNLVSAVMIGVLLFITLALTIMVSGQKKKTTLLIQEISLLKSKK